MKPLVKPPRRNDCPARVTPTSVTCCLTNKVYRWSRYDREGEQQARDQHAAEAGKIIDANNARAGKVLKLSDHLAMMRNEYDPRTERERILTPVDPNDIELRGNDPDDENQIRRAMQRIDPDSKRFGSPQRQAGLRRLEQLAAREDARRELEAAKESIRQDPLYANALDNADASLRLLANDPSSNPADIAAAKQRRDALANFEITVDGYWQAAREAEAAMRPADEEERLQRDADGMQLAEDLKKRSDEANE